MMLDMNYRVLGSIVAAAVIAFARPVAFIAQETGKAAEIIAAARKAIGGTRLDALKTFSVEASVDRNLGSMQIGSEVEVVLDLPDKYLRAETPRGGGGFVMAGGGVTGFNGDRALQKIQGGGAMPAGGGVMIRMGPGGPAPAGEKLTPEQIDQLTKQVVRGSRIEASRLMLGWFAAAHPAAHAEYVFAGEAESVEGRAYVIDVKNADNLSARLFIDEQTHLPLMVTYKGPQPRTVTSRGAAQADVEKQIQDLQRQPPALVDFALYFEDWRDVDGIKFPFKLRRAMAGSTTEEWTINKVKVNPKVDPKRFAGES